jgi:hypothetical protein
MDAVERSRVEPLTVEVRLEPVANPGGTVHVEGTVRVDGASPRAFSGWMALLQVFEALLDGRE